MTTDTNSNPHNIHEKIVQDLGPIITGPAGHEHFIIQANNLVCVRNTAAKDYPTTKCDTCPLQREGCTSKPYKIERNIIPSPRRGLGVEPYEFFVLIPQRSTWFEDIQTTPNLKYRHTRFAYLSNDPANNHYALEDFDSQKLQVLKGQHRFYGTMEELEESGLLDHYDIWTEYKPQHIFHSLDFSAIEPRVSTALSKTRQWLETFAGTPKIIHREVRIEDGVSLPACTMRHSTGVHCWLQGELDKSSYESQCSRCPIKDRCTPVNDRYMNVPGDWHMINARALFAEEVSRIDEKTPDGKSRLKDLRGIAKIVGLALMYGGSAYTVARNMHLSRDAAQRNIDSFFATLSDARQWMEDQRRTILSTGRISNAFGRIRDMSREAFSKDRKLLGYAERTSYNHPMQSTAADLLKLAMIRLQQWVERNKLNPLVGINSPQSIKLEDRFLSYRDFKYFLLMSVHDELDNLVREDLQNELYPQAYEECQIVDVSKAMGVDFRFELDLEYDATRSWTATHQFDRGKIYLLQHLAKQSTQTGQGRPLFLMKIEDLTQQHLEAIQIMAQANEASFAEKGKPNTLIFLGVQANGKTYTHKTQFTEAQILYLQTPFTRSMLVNTD